jgi:PAS domain S-box-containing protein
MFILKRKNEGAVSSTKRYFWYLTLLWTVLILTSGGWNVYQSRSETNEKARIEARTIFDHNIAYRRWNAMLGGVYAPVSEKNPPNPYLALPERDKVTRDGTRLTLVNPFRMTKQAYELLKQQSPLSAINRTVSLNALNPDNDPDAWERKGLEAFERKQLDEVSEVTEIGGKPYMRILKPYITVEGCLRCHGTQGYRPGDIRGAMSIAIPLEPYRAGEWRTLGTIAVSHLLLWLAGIVGIALFSRSIQRHESRIAESEWKFRTLSEFAYDWEYWIDEQKRLVFVSPSCEHITGYSKDEFMADPSLLSSIVHPEDREKYGAHLGNFRSPRHEELEIRIITKSGQVKWLSHGCEHIYVGDLFLGRRVSNRDITDRKMLEEQLRQSQKMESLGVLAGGVAHDFNNLLTAVSGYASMLRKKLGGADESIRGYLHNMLNATERAKSLTRNLLAFGRKQIVRPGPVSLKAAADNISGLLRRIIGEDVELRISCSDIEFPVFGDQHQIEQVLMNLVTNSRDAMPAGGAVSVSTNPVVLDAGFAARYNAKAGEYMALAVDDSGSGIDDQDLPHIFEPFFTKKEKGKGTGLGLAIVYGIVKQHEGFITVQSERGRGTTFTIYLPAAPRDQRVRERGRHSDGSAADAYRGSGTILVAEDDETVRTFLRDILQDHGYAVITAEDGQDAVDAFNANRDAVNLVILDVVMPKKNGGEVYDVIKAAAPGMQFIFVSGYPQDILTTKGALDEDLEFIPKPLDIENLLLKMRVMLETRAHS